MRALASFVTGRRTKWLVLVLWVIVFVGLFPVGAKLADETTDDTASYLPQSAESTEVVEILDDEFSSGETTQGLIVYENPDGLNSADKRKIAADAQEIQRAKDEVPLTRPPSVPFTPGAPSDLVSPNGDVAYTVLTVPTNFDESADWGKAVRDITGEEAGGMRILLTGDIGFSADAEEVFGDLDTKLLGATVLLVLILLGLIYRAVLVALTPLIVVFFSYTVATAFVYLYAKSGASVSSNGTTILVVLMFGVGTDYSLLLVSRYREELRASEDKHDAMHRALSRTGTTILASGLTVALAMLVLVLADTGLTNSLGPVAAIGVACAFVAGLTLLPALLTIFGRTGFWPRRTLVEYDPGPPATARQGLWRRFGDRVLERPLPPLPSPSWCSARRAWPARVQGRLQHHELLQEVGGQRRGLRRAGSIVPGRDAGADHGAGGALRWTRHSPDVAEAVQRVDAVDGVARATPTGLRSENGQIASIDVILEGDPYVQSTFDVVPRIRDAVAELGPGVTGLVGGGSAIQYDLDQAINSDLRLIVPIALAVIAVILALLLWSLLAPLVLIASVILSFLCTLGSRCCSSATWSGTLGSTPRCRPSRSSSWSRSGSTTRSS